MPRTYPKKNTKKRKNDFPDTKVTYKKRKRWGNVPIIVVDEHNDAMLPFIDAVAKGKLPSEGVTMLHFDSHPDLGNFEKTNEHVNNLAKGNCSKKNIHSLTDIATWITPLVLAGWLKEVIWCAGHWCHQIEDGTYDLVCGLTNKNKICCASADGDNENNQAIVDYWECDGTAAKLSQLKFKKKWTLHVVKLNKKGKFSDSNFNEILDIVGETPWVLDIDEDFYSCNNPHRDDFEACFGKQNWSQIKRLYDIGSPWDDEYEKILQKKIFLRKEDSFWKNKSVQKLIQGLEENNEKKPKELLEKLRKMLCCYYKKEYPDGVNIEELFNLEEFHVAGLYSGLPHHISRVDEIVQLANSTEELLVSIIAQNRPAFVTLATSRADRYLPDCQAAIIHGMLEQMMELLFDDKVKVNRMDRPKFSIVFADESESE